MKAVRIPILLAGLAAVADRVSSLSCPDYSAYSQDRHAPFSSGKYALSYQRPIPACRTFNSSTLETLVANVTSTIADPDLARLFENTYPNTLDTAIRWRGRAANNSAEELTFIITGDINAMWLRDSANQLRSYQPLLAPDPGPDSLASLYRGAINLQARYLLAAPFCNSFQPPPESGIPPAQTGAASDAVSPAFDPAAVFECKYELDSLAAFLQLSVDYYEATHDAAFFGAFQWLPAVRAVLATAKAMMTAPTYGPDGAVLASPYTFTRQTTRATETLANDGRGSPVAAGTGLIRSAFRPSDDSTLFQLLIPANMLFARYLGSAALIVAELGDRAPRGLADEMVEMGRALRAAITRYGIVPVMAMPSGAGNGSSASAAEGEVETVYAYEVDGFGSAAIMDDANIPSLLAAPFFGYLANTDPVYRRTRARILDATGPRGNPYFMRGPAISAVGGPHVGPGKAWPMASIVQILTSDDDAEIVRVLRQILSTTDGLGLIHESVDSFNASQWTRQWFSWANGLFGQMILDLRFRKPHLLKQSFQ